MEAGLVVHVALVGVALFAEQEGPGSRDVRGVSEVFVIQNEVFYDMV